jgi:serine/threonine protein kinase
MEARADDLTGKVIASQFQVERKLGQGGMGAVYLAEQLEMGRKVVLKVMHPSLLGSAAGPVIEERFKREARMVAQLNHPNVVQVYVFGRTDDQQLYMAMEYIEGRTLRELLLDRQRLPEARALRILDQICGALIEAHDLGLVHRDLKPENVMLTDRHGNPDYVKVLDFGIAKMRTAPDVRLTQTGAVFGTVQYMAPEQARAQAVDQRTDIYALGVILYELVSGQLPFSADSVFEYMLKQVDAPVVLPTRRFPELVILPRTEAIIARALEKAPANRFQSASELQRELRLALADRPDAGKPFPTPPVPRSGPGGNAGFAGVAPLGGAGAAAAGGTAILPPEEGVGASADATALRAPTGRARGGPARPSVFPSAGPVAGAAGAPPAGIGKKLVIVAVVLALGGFAVYRGVRPGSLGPSGLYLPSGARLVEGLPVPAGAEAEMVTPQALILATELDPHAILDFYRQQTGAWGPVRQDGSSLHFTDEKAPITYVSFARSGSHLQVVLVRSVFAPPPPSVAALEAFGVPVPAGAERTLLTATAAIFQAARPTREVIAFYREKLGTAPDLQVTETNAATGSFLVISATDPGRPFANISVLATPDALKPRPGVWTQIAITARPKSE